MGRGSRLQRMRMVWGYHSKGQNTAPSLLPLFPKPLGIVSRFLLLVARIEESLWGFRLGQDRILSAEQKLWPSSLPPQPCLPVRQMGSAQIHPHSHPATTPGNHSSFYFLFSFAFYRISYNWNYTVYDSFRLAYFP